MPVSLRKLNLEDESTLILLANDPKIADDMTTMPSPFKPEDAQELIARSDSTGEDVMGLIDTESNDLLGVVMLRDFEPQHEQAELSVWIGQPYWGKGYGTQALQAMISRGFSEYKLNRIYAYCMVRNTGSQRILEKSGFTREGYLRDRVIVKDIYEDVYIYAILKSDLD